MTTTPTELTPVVKRQGENAAFYLHRVLRAVDTHRGEGRPNWYQTMALFLELFDGIPFLANVDDEARDLLIRMCSDPEVSLPVRTKAQMIVHDLYLPHLREEGDTLLEAE